MKRPQITRELIEATAVAFGANNDWNADQVADVIRVSQGISRGGYWMAKDLDVECGWRPTAQDVETLERFGREVRDAHRNLCIAWARDNNIQPQLQVGTMTTIGEITGISKYYVASYEIRIPGASESSRRIVRFEDAREAPSLVA
jgi:hypothetical protein